MRLLSIDQSLTCSGIMVWDNKNVVHFACIKTKNDIEVIYRIRYILDEIRSIVEKYSITKVVVESLPYGAVSRSVRPLAALYYLIHHTCIDLGIEFTESNVTSVKKLATGKGNAKKETMILALQEQERGLFNDILKAGFKKTTGLADLADSYFIGKLQIEKDKA